MRSWSTIAAWARIRIAPGCRCRHLRQVLADRRHAAAGVDQHRQAVLLGQREHRVEPVVVDGELLGARVQLDAAGAEREAAARLVDRALVEVEPGQRHEQAVGLGGPAEHAVVRRAVRRRAVGLVQREDERAAHVPARACARASSAGRGACRPRRARGACGHRRAKGRAAAGARRRARRGSSSRWASSRADIALDSNGWARSIRISARAAATRRSGPGAAGGR